MAKFFTLYCISVLLFVITLTFTNAQMFSLIVEPPGQVTSYAVRSVDAPLEFSYATPDNALGAPDTPESEAAQRPVVIIADLQGSNLNLSQCYIGNGLLQREHYMEYKQHLVVRSITVTGQFFSVLCTLGTPQEEQPAVDITATIYELLPQYKFDTTTNLPTGSVTLLDVVKDILGDETDPYRIGHEPDEERTITYSTRGATPVTVGLPPVYTEEDVFSWYFKFVPGQRLLLNETEVDWIRAKLVEFVNDKSKTINNILVLDHDVDLDDNKQVEAINLRLYTEGTVSQYDFRLGLATLFRTWFAQWAVPLELMSLTHSTDRVYRSACFNSKQDFDETSVNCGDPKVAVCGKCWLVNSVCDRDEQCSSNECIDRRCVVKYGTRNQVSASIVHFSMFTAVIIMVIAMLFM